MSRACSLASFRCSSAISASRLAAPALKPLWNTCRFLPFSKHGLQPKYSSSAARTSGRVSLLGSKIILCILRSLPPDVAHPLKARPVLLGQLVLLDQFVWVLHRPSSISIVATGIVAAPYPL